MRPNVALDPPVEALLRDPEGASTRLDSIVILSATVTEPKGSIKRGLQVMEIEKILHTQHFGREPEAKVGRAEMDSSGLQTGWTR